jgi:hypothetical protein
MLNETFILWMSGLIVTLSCIAGVTYYHVKKTEFIKHSIDAAIEKGISPLAVRCSYVSGVDSICAIYAGNIKP